MRFGPVDLTENWQQRIERELRVEVSAIDENTPVAEEAPPADAPIQFGQWPAERGMHFEHEPAD